MIAIFAPSLRSIGGKIVSNYIGNRRPPEVKFSGTARYPKEIHFRMNAAPIPLG